MSSELPPIPPKRYFTIGEVSELCMVKPYVLRYWEQEFTQLRPMKRRGNRRYYQHHEVLLVRRIRELLYEKRFTISGARDRLAESSLRAGALAAPDLMPDEHIEVWGAEDGGWEASSSQAQAGSAARTDPQPSVEFDLRRELLAIRRMLSD
ncbi:MAG: MerR family transcriptional regulator [Betaproteobacteria bacterium]